MRPNVGDTAGGRAIPGARHRGQARTRRYLPFVVEMDVGLKAPIAGSRVMVRLLQRHKIPAPPLHGERTPGRSRFAGDFLRRQLIGSGGRRGIYASVVAARVGVCGELTGELR
jgi:hypothetical protein